MVAILSRRSMLGGGVSALLFSVSWSPLMMSSLEDVAPFLCRYTPRDFREAVRDSGGLFLYRGDEENTGVPAVGRICHPVPDLLRDGTYEDPEAVAYFECLEDRLSQVAARPSTGHMGTSVVADAALWGNVVSVWPLGSHFSFVWPADASAFVRDSNRCPDMSELAVDRDLPAALRKGREVLFASWFDSNDILPSVVSSTWVSAFVAIPRKYDERLLRLLRMQNFGL